MSKRIGLRCMSYIVKKAVVGPSGEQMVNGDFETGDTTGWSGGGVVDAISPHSGTYKLWISLLQQLVILAQAADIDIPVSYITSFGFWHWNDSDKRVKILYTDSSDSGELTIPVAASWTYFNLIPYLTAGKNVKNISFYGGNVLGVLNLDDVSLYC